MPWYILFFATSNHKVSYVLKTIEITERNIKKKIPRFFRPLILSGVFVSFARPPCWIASHRTPKIQKLLILKLSVLEALQFSLEVMIK